MDLEDWQSREGGRGFMWPCNRAFLLPRLSALWYLVHGENTTRLDTFSEDPPKYSPDDDGESSGVPTACCITLWK